MTNITTAINEVIAAYDEMGSNSYLFKHVYAKYETVLNRHKLATLKHNLDMPVTLTGRLCRRGDGSKGNLNLISPAYINGVKVEHLHVYDEVLECADINSTTNMFIATNQKVYEFGKNHSDFSNGLGIKPSDAPIWVDRNERV